MQYYATFPLMACAKFIHYQGFVRHAPCSYQNVFSALKGLDKQFDNYLEQPEKPLII